MAAIQTWRGHRAKTFGEWRTFAATKVLMEATATTPRRSSLVRLMLVGPWGEDLVLFAYSSMIFHDVVTLNMSDVQRFNCISWMMSEARSLLANRKKSHNEQLRTPFHDIFWPTFHLPFGGFLQ